MSQEQSGGRFIFVANDIMGTSATRIAETLLAKGFWAFAAAAPHLRRLAERDQVLIYLAGPKRRYFVARATLGSGVTGIGHAEGQVLRSLGLTFLRYQVKFRDVTKLEPPVPIEPLLSGLDFIKDKRNWGLHLRLPIVRIGEHDFVAVMGAIQRLSG